MGLVNWMYLHLRVDVHSGTKTQYHSLKRHRVIHSATES
ncbi:unnamed protein product [Schistosoma margrebowiei]|uniref:Uncharacterized protein n=1 Tax=Schistosoma margrebowiei TaxID=48269 RepID=A0A3P8CP85_9TREM|nr:unnamed protein product [Schistosoma margrebowiei]